MGTRALLIAAMVVGCGGSQRPTGTGAPKIDVLDDVRGDGIEELLDRTSRGDIDGLAGMLSDPLGFGGLWFPDTTCRREFAIAGTIPSDGLAIFAKCLGALRFGKSEREHPYPDVAVLTYEPGIEIEVLFAREGGKPKIRWIGYASRRSKDALPTVSQEALEAKRIDPAPIDLDGPTRDKIAAELAATKAASAFTWFKVCINATGAVTGVHPRETSSLAAQAAFAAAIEKWTFHPFTLGGQPSPVCSLVLVDTEKGLVAGSAKMPFPVPDDQEGAIVMPAGTFKGEAGNNTQIAPDEGSLEWMNQNGISRIAAVLMYCLDESGKVDSVMLMSSSGVPGYDEKLTHDIAMWKFAPVMLDGKGVRACSHVNLVYEAPK